MSFEEGVFFAIDDDAVAGNSPAARPMDEYLAHARRAQLEYLDDFGHGVGYAPVGKNAGQYSVYAGERPHCSYAQSSLLYIPWIYQRGLVELSCHGVGRAASEGAGSIGVTITQQLFRIKDKEVIPMSAKTAAFESKSASDPFKDFHIESLPLSVDTPYTAPYVLWVQGVQGASVASSASTTVYNDLTIEATNAGFYSAGTGTRPNASGLDTQHTLGERIPVDHLGPGGTTVRQDVTPAAVLGDISRRHTGYLQLRGLQIEQRFKTPGISPSQFNAMLPVLGETEQSLAILRDNIHRRLRPLWVGPQGGNPPPESGWPADYRTRFSRLSGLGTGGIFFKATCLPSTLSPTLRILAYFAPIYAIIDASGPALGGGAVTFDVENPPAAQWSFSASVQQLDAGDNAWSEATVLGGSTYTVPQDARLVHRPHDGTGDDPLGYAEFSRAQNRYPYREGQLFTQDLGRLQLFSLEVPLTYDPASQTPVRVVLSASLDDSGIEWYGDTVRDATRISLVCVGASIWEVPR